MNFLVLIEIAGFPRVCHIIYKIIIYIRFSIEHCFYDYVNMRIGDILLASERSERDTLWSVQLRIADILS